MATHISAHIRVAAGKAEFSQMICEAQRQTHVRSLTAGVEGFRGGWKPVARARPSNARAADNFAANIIPIIDQIKAAGVTSLHDIAAALTTRGVQTARGGAWYPSTVKNVCDRTNA